MGRQFAPNRTTYALVPRRMSRSVWGKLPVLIRKQGVLLYKNVQVPCAPAGGFFMLLLKKK